MLSNYCEPAWMGLHSVMLIGDLAKTAAALRAVPCLPGDDMALRTARSLLGDAQITALDMHFGDWPVWPVVKSILTRMPVKPENEMAAALIHGDYIHAANLVQKYNDADLPYKMHLYHASVHLSSERLLGLLDAYDVVLRGDAHVEACAALFRCMHEMVGCAHSFACHLMDLGRTSTAARYFAELTPKIFLSPHYNTRCIMHAASRDMKTLNWFLARFPGTIGSDSDTDGFTPLLEAVFSRNKTAVANLLAAGADAITSFKGRGSALDVFTHIIIKRNKCAYCKQPKAGAASWARDVGTGGTRHAVEGGLHVIDSFFVLVV